MRKTNSTTFLKCLEIQNQGQTLLTVGILIGHTELEPFEVVKRIKELVHDEPWRVRYILRLIPIEFAFTEDGLDSIKRPESTRFKDAKI